MTDAEFLKGFDPRVATDYERVFEGAVALDALPQVEQALILLGLYAVHGDASEVRAHGDRALRDGAAPGAVLEVVLAAGMSRGTRALSTARGYLSELAWSAADDDRASAADPMAYLCQEFGDPPAWAKTLAEVSPDVLAGYASLRERILRDGAAPRRTKELLTMALNAVGGNRGGIVSHASAALRSGADAAQVLEALILAVRVGGIVAWISGIEAVEHLVKPDGQA